MATTTTTFEPSFKKLLCSALYFVIVCLTIASICCYWRSAHKQDVDIIIDGQKLTFEYEGVIKRFGIVRNCQEVLKDDCEMAKGTGFVDDTTILVLQSIALGIYVFNIVVMAVSHLFNPIVLHIPQITCVIAFLLNLYSIYTFNRNYNQYYYPYSLAELEKLGNAFLFYKFGDESIVGQYIYKITYTIGFYTTLASLIIGVFAFCVTAYTLDTSSKEANNDGNGRRTYVGMGTWLRQIETMNWP